MDPAERKFGKREQAGSCGRSGSLFGGLGLRKSNAEITEHPEVYRREPHLILGKLSGLCRDPLLLDEIGNFNGNLFTDERAHSTRKLSWIPEDNLFTYHGAVVVLVHRHLALLVLSLSLTERLPDRMLIDERFTIIVHALGHRDD